MTRGHCSFSIAIVVILQTVTCNQWNARTKLEANGSTLTAFLELNPSNESYLYFKFTLVRVDTISDKCALGLECQPPAAITLGNFEKKSILSTDFQVVENGFYCFSVKPLHVDYGGNCHSLCRSIFSQVIQYNGTKKIGNLSQSEHTNCSTWTYQYNFVQIPNSNKSSFAWKVLEPHDVCFEAFHVTLLQVLNYCQLGTVIHSYVLNTPINTLITKELKPGNYCFRILPNEKHSCYGRICDPVYTKTLEIVENIPLPTRILGFKTEKDSNYIWYIVCGVLAFVVFGSLLLFLRAIRRGRLPSSGSEGGLLPTTESAPPVQVDDDRQDLTIIYSQETAVHLEVVKCLASFLHAETGRKVHLDVNEFADIYINRENWYSSVEKKSKVIILVESEGAVRRQRAHQDQRILRHEEEDLLDDMFILHLSYITSEPRNMLNYRRLAVVRFPYTPRESRFEYVVEQMRYNLPFLLFELVQSFQGDLPEAETIDLKVRTIEHWSQYSPEYRALLCAVADAEQWVRENPNFAQKLFIYDEL